PIHVQARELADARSLDDYTIREWVDFDGATYVEHEGEVDLLPGIRLLPAPGHTDGHQVVVVETGAGTNVLGGDVGVWFGELVSGAMVLATSVTLAAPAQAHVDGTCVVKITRFAWVPSQVHAGDHTKLVLTARNCTDRSIDITVTEFGEQIPPCPTVDPIGDAATLEPFGRYAPQPLRMIAPPYTGVEVMGVRITDSDQHVLARTAAT